MARDDTAPVNESLAASERAEDGFMVERASEFEVSGIASDGVEIGEHFVQVHVRMCS